MASDNPFANIGTALGQKLFVKHTPPPVAEAIQEQPLHSRKATKPVSQQGGSTPNQQTSKPPRWQGGKPSNHLPGKPANQQTSKVANQQGGKVVKKITSYLTEESIMAMKLFAI